jgi:hypothetical protein
MIELVAVWVNCMCGLGNRKTQRVALVAGLAAVGLVVGMSAPPAAPDERGPSFRQLLRAAPAAVARDGDHHRRLVFVERNAMEADIDNAPAGFSAGDEVAIASALARDGKRVGRFDGHVVYTYVNLDADGVLRALLNATASLRNGEIEVQGVATFRVDTADFTFAVVGGTRRYEGVEGAFHVVEDGDTVRYVFDLE